LTKKQKILIFFAAMMLLVAVVIGLFFAVKTRYIPLEVGLLLFICLLGLYVGFGILIGAYRLVSKLN